MIDYILPWVCCVLVWLWKSLEIWSLFKGSEEWWDNFMRAKLKLSAVSEEKPQPDLDVVIILAAVWRCEKDLFLDQRGRILSLLTECMLSYLYPLLIYYCWIRGVIYLCLNFCRSPLRPSHTSSERPVEAVSWGRQVLGLARVGCRASPQPCMPSVSMPRLPCMM